MSWPAEIDFAAQQSDPISSVLVLGVRANKKKDEMMFQLLDRIGLLGRRWATFIQVRRELETYSDRELNDMGMSRADIGRIALEAASLVKPDAGKRAGAEDRRPQLLRQRFSPYL